MKKLALVGFFLLATGCIKAPNVDTGLGPEATSDDMEKTVSKALYGIDPFSAAVGQQVVYHFNMRVENQDQVQPVANLTQTVLKRDVTSSPADNGLVEEDLALVIENYEFDFSTGKTDRSELPAQHYRRLVKAPAALPPSLTSVTKTLAPLSLLQPAESRPVKRTTYHNLKDESGVMSPPDAVVAKANCGGVPNCKLRFMHITYDEASWYSDTDYTVHKWSYVISRDAPFIAYIMERCLAGMLGVNGRNYYVRQCQFARDFSYQGETPPRD